MQEIYISAEGSSIYMNFKNQYNHKIIELVMIYTKKHFKNIFVQSWQFNCIKKSENAYIFDI